jgi:hypothetical protein
MSNFKCVRVCEGTFFNSNFYLWVFSPVQKLGFEFKLNSFFHLLI